ncbi:MAG: helix-turn-helix domain-containing protein [Clostridiales bacterium]|nr:helix-turn-helix domain-containing protein [Clostridiales bacterium]
MNQEYYLIKEAAAKVGVESHVLRYWEEELKMDIHRNAMGHRYYTEKDIEILSKVKDLKEKGLQLKAIRDYLEKRRQQLLDGTNDSKTDAIRAVAEDKSEIIPVKQHIMTSDEDKMEQFQRIMNRVLSNAIKENNELIGKTAGEHAANAVVVQMQGMTKEQEERAEARYRKLDQTLREIQRARAEAAASGVHSVDRRKQKRLKRKVAQTKQPSIEKEDCSDTPETNLEKSEV